MSEAAKRTVVVDRLSVQSLLLETLVGTNRLMTATGFVVNPGGRPHLVTNWHVVAGRDPDTEQPLHPSGGIPDQLAILHHRRGALGKWIRVVEHLYAEGKPRWLEHPSGRKVDLIALPLQQIPESTEIFFTDIRLATADMMVGPGMPVAIIGFPFGLGAGGSWPIWKTGHIATDPGIDYDEKPAFLIDATTRQGMSGSPVVLRATGGFTDSEGNQVIGAGVVTKFLGIYSGRIHGDAELGRVWRPEALDAVLGLAAGTKY